MLPFFMVYLLNKPYHKKNSIMKTISLFLILCSLLACNEETKNIDERSCCHDKSKNMTSCTSPYIDSLKKEIMAVHDEVMPQTSHLIKLREVLNKKMKTDTASISLLEPTFDSLKLAHDEMMTWMQNYNASDDVLDTAYFIKQKEDISVVNKLYKSVITSAEEKTNE